MLTDIEVCESECEGEEIVTTVKLSGWALATLTSALVTWIHRPGRRAPEDVHRECELRDHIQHALGQAAAKTGE